MKKIWNIFKEYYLAYAIFSFVLFVMSYFMVEEHNKSALYSFLFAMIFFVFMALVGTAELLSHTYYRPWKRNKMLNSSPFIEFKRKGFRIDGDQYKGCIRGYNLFIGILWKNYQKKPIYYVQILFNPFSYERFLRQDEREKFNQELVDKNEVISLNSLIINFKRYKGLKKTNSKMILDKINKAIDFLKARKLSYIEYKKWDGFVEKVISYEETFVYE